MMRRPWSLSTTVRNPERLRGFLRVLKELEGEPFDSRNQMLYQVRLIQARLYRPTDLTPEQERLFDDPDADISLELARTIFESQGYEDPAMRGRTSVAPLVKMGFCVARQADPPIQITPLGEQFLAEDGDWGEIFFRYFLKWQLPNPIDKGSFTAKAGFGIKPFIGTLHLIDRVNKRWQEMGHEPVGISKLEFSLFVPTLIHRRDIDDQVDKLIDFRTKYRNRAVGQDREEFTEQYKHDFAASFLNSTDTGKISRLVRNLRDYGDNTLRYFRLTRYLRIRGSGRYVDLEPQRLVEINKLLGVDDARPRRFKGANEYAAYLTDVEQPTLPWETSDELLNIAAHLGAAIREVREDLAPDTEGLPVPVNAEAQLNSIDELRVHVEELRQYHRTLLEYRTHIQSQDVKNIQKYISGLKEVHRFSRQGIELERLAVLALNALNNAVKISPNYPVGDDNEPTFTAPGGKPDIECYYDQFNAICEVTMLRSRDQWINEGQPVMRHMREFEQQHSDKPAYCLFVAPKLHADTIETFWNGAKHGYRGARQHIVPITIEQLIQVLKILIEAKQQGKDFQHELISTLYQNIANIVDEVDNSDIWIERIPEVIAKWRKTVLECGK